MGQEVSLLKKNKMAHKFGLNIIKILSLILVDLFIVLTQCVLYGVSFDHPVVTIIIIIFFVITVLQSLLYLLKRSSVVAKMTILFFWMCFVVFYIYHFRPKLYF
jgi:hypothetical protein